MGEHIASPSFQKCKVCIRCPMPVTVSSSYPVRESLTVVDTDGRVDTLEKRG